MKKFLLLCIPCLIIVGLAFCGGNVRNVTVQEYTSDIYTDQEIESAIKATKTYFKLHFPGCTLTEITYAGDDISQNHTDWAERNNADDVIVLKSSFDVGASGGDGSLNPNSTYTHWSWILVRDEGGKWRYVDHGY